MCSEPDMVKRTPPAKSGPTRRMRNTQVESPRVEPRLPHERDESTDSQGDAAPDNAPIGRQAHDDVQRGLVDTDRGPVVDDIYNDKVRGRAPRKKLR
jgi:hypothetical protein